MSDQFIGYYQMIHKTRKYRKTLFFHFIDVMVTNAYLLYIEHLPPHKKVRELLMTELCEADMNEQEQLQSPQSRSLV